MNDHIKFEGNTLRESPQFEAKAEDFASQLRSCNMDSDDGNIHGAARKIPFNPNAIYPLKFAEDCGCNTTDEVLLAQVNANIRRGLPQARPHMPNSTVVALVCGGPSLKLTEKELARVAWSGAKVVAVNGAYQWCIDRNIRPSAAVMLDAREFNSRFFQEPVEGCKYFLASQCHPATYEVCRDREVYVWHACTTGEPELEIITDYYFAKAYPVTIGTTVAIRAIGLFRMLGFQYFEIFGLDSCWLGDDTTPTRRKRTTSGSWPFGCGRRTVMILRSASSVHLGT